MEFKPVRSQLTNAHSQHNRQRFLQIWLPLGLAAAIALGVGVWAIVAATAPGSTMTHWADVSAVLVILPILLAGVLYLTILVGSIYLVARLYRGLPGLDRKIQAVYYRIEIGVRRAADQVVKPVNKVNGWSASVKALRDALFRR
jgi:hypothetical protein